MWLRQVLSQLQLMRLLQHPGCKSLQRAAVLVPLQLNGSAHHLQLCPALRDMSRTAACNGSTVRIHLPASRSSGTSHCCTCRSSRGGSSHPPTGCMWLVAEPVSRACAIATGPSALAMVRHCSADPRGSGICLTAMDEMHEAQARCATSLFPETHAAQRVQAVHARSRGQPAPGNEGAIALGTSGKKAALFDLNVEGLQHFCELIPLVSRPHPVCLICVLGQLAAPRQDRGTITGCKALGRWLL